LLIYYDIINKNTSDQFSIRVEMEKFIIIGILCLTWTTNSYSQVISSTKSSIKFNSTAKEKAVTPPPVDQNIPKRDIEQNLNPGKNDISLVAFSENNLETRVAFKVDYQPKIALTIPGAEGKYYALIIGVNNYSDPSINELYRSIKDAEMFYNVITSRYTFDKENIKLMRNATYAEIVDALDHFAKIIKPADNFLIFYAGHGIWDPSSKISFWLPYDAEKSSKLAWFRNSTLRDYLQELKSKHTLLISDAFFAGSIFKSRSAFTYTDVAINKLYELPSRKAMTSGTLTQVPDKSVFLKYMIDRLHNNMDKYITSEELFNKFRMAVINNSNIVPQFGVIQYVGDEGGDFIFMLKE